MIDKKITEIETSSASDSNRPPRDPFFTKQFRHYYKVLWLDKGKNDKEFREEVERLYMERTGTKYKKDGKTPFEISKNSMTQWKQGTCPRKYFVDIAHALGFKDESIFISDGNPEYDEVMRHEIDRVRFEYAREIGLDKNFMLFILHAFTGAEWGRVDYYYYLRKHPAADRFPDEKGPFGETFDEISKDTLKALQCRFEGIPEDETGDNFLIHLPTKGDLDFMLLLQKRIEQHIKVELDGMREYIENDLYLNFRGGPNSVNK